VPPLFVTAGPGVGSPTSEGRLVSRWERGSTMSATVPREADGLPPRRRAQGRRVYRTAKPPPRGSHAGAQVFGWGVDAVHTSSRAPNTSEEGRMSRFRKRFGRTVVVPCGSGRSRNSGVRMGAMQALSPTVRGDRRLIRRQHGDCPACAQSACCGVASRMAVAGRRKSRAERRRAGFDLEPFGGLRRP
jgi:hypothetical protein